MTQASMLARAWSASGTDRPLPSSPTAEPYSRRMLDRGDAFATAAVITGFTAAEPLP